MSNVTFTACKCLVVDECKKEECECRFYCEVYSHMIHQFDNPVYVTMSPNPHNFLTYEKTNKEHLDDIILKLAKACRECVVVMELAGGLRPHYHGVFDVKDKVGFNIRLMNYAKYNNAKKHNKFKGGYHYIFKEVDSTRVQAEVEPITIGSDLIASRLKEKKERRLREYGKNVAVTRLPEWLSNCGYDKDAKPLNDTWESESADSVNPQALRAEDMNEALSDSGL